MARIRSVHPGLFKDEAVMELSMAARFLAIGIWTLADDHGVFEYKPKVIRAELFPGDNVEIEALLGELVTHGLIKRFEDSGRPYAVVRNFCLYQRPKMPSYRHPFPEAIASYAGVERRSAEELVQASAKKPHVRPDNSDSATPALSQPSTSATEKPPHRRGEESSRREEDNPKTNIESLERVPPAEENLPPAPPSDSLSVSKAVSKKEGQGLKALGTQLPETWTPDGELCEQVRSEFGMTDENIRAELLAFHAHHAQSGAFSANWSASFFTFCKRWKEHKDKQAAPRVEFNRASPGTFQPTEKDWDGVAALYARTGRWSSQFGPDPMSPACRCPKRIMERHGIDPATGEVRRKAAVSA
jgi:hypothetical protein